MARFRGNVHAASDRVAATLLFIVLLIIVLLVGWYLLDPAGFNNFVNTVLNNRRP